jgi:hypothetical protein
LTQPRPVSVIGAEAMIVDNLTCFAGEGGSQQTGNTHTSMLGELVELVRRGYDDQVEQPLRSPS